MDILSAYDPRQGLPSASAFGRLALCPGSFTMEKACPDESSDAASEGTLLHAYMEQLLTGEPWEGTPLTAEQAELCERALRLLDRVKEMIERDNLGAAFHLISTEERVFYRNLFGTAYYSGQWDALFKIDCPDDNCLLVVDWKFGRVEVKHAEENCQLEALVPLVTQKTCEDGVSHSGIYAAIIQPRVAGPASVAFYDAEAIDQAEQRSLAVAKAAMDPDAPRYCSEAACRYCRAKAVCHEATAMVEQASLIATDRDKWELFSAEEKVHVYRLAKTAKKWAAAVEYRFEQDVAASLIPGFEMGAGKTSFAVTDAAAAFTFLNDQFPGTLTAEAFAGCCKVGITDLDKLFHEACKKSDPRATTKSSKEYLRQILAEYGEMKTTKGSVKEIGGGAA